MNKVETSDTKALARKLFEQSPPVLVEVRFPRCGTSPDWYLYEDEEDFLQLLGSLAEGAEIFLNSVWDLKNTKQTLSIKT